MGCGDSQGSIVLCSRRCHSQAGLGLLRSPGLIISRSQAPPGNALLARLRLAPSWKMMRSLAGMRYRVEPGHEKEGPMTPLTAAVVGTGFIGPVHVEALRR